MYHIEESYQKERRSAALIFSTKGKRIEGWEGGGEWEALYLVWKQ